MSVGYSDKYIIFAHIIHTNKINKVMASIAQLVSEIAHSVKQPDSVPVRRAIKLGIIHARNEAIRRSYGNHNYTDKVLQQRFRLTLTDVPDGDLAGSQDIVRDKVKRTTNKVPRPTRLINNLPFHSVRTSGMKNLLRLLLLKKHLLNIILNFRVCVLLLLMIILMNIFILIFQKIVNLQM